MEVYWKGAAGVLVALVLLGMLSRQPDMSQLLSLGACVLILGAAASYLKPVLAFLQELETAGDLQADFLGILLKVLGIGLCSQIIGLLCQDAGAGALGKSAQLLGSAAILWTALPLLRGFLGCIQGVLCG